VADDLGEVLHEGTPRGHRHDLHPAAHAEHRGPPPTRDPGQGELPGVAVAAWTLRRRVRLLVVPARLDVGAPGDDEAVEAREHGIGHPLVRVLAGGQHDGDRPRPLEVVDVAVREHDAVLLHPRRAVDGLDVGRDADDRRTGAHGIHLITTG
jgi:hypothetical protein